MNRWLKMTATCSMAAMLTVGMAATAECGLIHHKTTVYNKSDKDVQVFLHYGVGGGNRKDQYIKAGQSYVFDTGRKCPYSFTGFVYNPSVDLVKRCLSGRENAEVCVVVCGSTDWFIKQHSDGAYHFDKHE